jgi:4-carboxymuconolactone decarboxylase
VPRSARRARVAAARAPRRVEPATERALPRDVDPRSRSRLPPVERDRLDALGQRLYDSIVDPRTGLLAGLQGPSGIWLHVPALAEHTRAINRYLRNDAGLAPRLVETAILVTARELDSAFEWTTHEAVARREGLGDAAIDCIKHAGSLARVPMPERLVVRFGREMLRGPKVAPTTYRAALAALGEQGVVHLVALIGYYAMTAFVLRAFDQQLLPGARSLLPVRPQRARPTRAAIPSPSRRPPRASARSRTPRRRSRGS